MENQSIFAKILDRFEDIVEDWSITKHEIKCFLLHKEQEINQERVDKMVNLLTVASSMYDNPKVITIGGKTVYAKLSPSEIIQTEQHVKFLLSRRDSLELLAEVTSIASEGEPGDEIRYV
jgi:hypothetical protein